MNRTLNITEEELRENINNIVKDRKIWLDDRQSLTVYEICSLLINANKFSINANACICGNNIDEAGEFGRCIVDLLESILNWDNCVVKVPCESLLYTDWESQYKYKDIKYIFIPDIRAITNKDGAVDERATEKRCHDLKIKLEEIEKASWKYSVIACTDMQMIEEIKKHREDDGRLYHYLLGTNKLYLKKINADGIVKFICHLLENKGFKLDEKFRSKLDIYVKAVYEDASYKEHKFADDCVDRIMHEYCKKLSESYELTDTDVPYSQKAQKLRQELQQKESASKSETTDTKTENKEAENKEAEIKEAEIKEAENKEVENKEAEIKEAEIKEAEIKEAENKEVENKEAEIKEAEIKEAEIKEAEIKETENKEKEPYDELKEINSIIDKIEPYPELKELEEKEIIGDAGIFLVLSSLEKKKYLCLSEAYEIDDKDIDVKSYNGSRTNDAPIQYLIDKVFSENYNLKKIVCISTQETNIGTDTYKRFCKLVEKYIEKRWEKEKVDISSILFESRIIGEGNITTDDSVYSAFYSELSRQTEGLNAFYVDYTGGLRDTSFLMVAAVRFLEFKGIKCKKVVYSDYFSKSKRIKALDKAYGLFQMINGMSEFVSSGTTRQLMDAFEKEQESKNELIVAIREFAHATNVGDVLNIDTYVNNLNAALVKPTDGNDLKAIMIDSMKDVIRKKIFGEDTNAKLIDNNNKINYYRLIDWCIENRMYQQAATLYIEKVPIVYYREEIITDEIINRKKLDKKLGSTKEAIAFYTELSKLLVQPPELEKLKKWVGKIKVRNYKDRKAEFERFVEEIKKYFQDTFYDDEERSICKRLIDIINLIYIDYNKSQNIEGDIPPCFKNDKGENIIQNDIEKYIKVINNDEKHQFYLLYGRLDEYNEYSSIVNKSDKYRNMDIIENVYKRNTNNLEQWRTNNDKYLSVLMAFYLAIKILRNKMSHASESKNDNLDKELRDFLNKTILEKIELFLDEDFEKKTEISLEEDLEQKEEIFFDKNVNNTKLNMSLEEKDIHNILKVAMYYTKKASEQKIRISRNKKFIADSQKKKAVLIPNESEHQEKNAECTPNKPKAQEGNAECTPNKPKAQEGKAESQKNELKSQGTIGPQVNEAELQEIEYNTNEIKIKNIQIGDYNGKEYFKFYVQIVIYVLHQFSNKRAKLKDIINYLEEREETLPQLPMKCLLSEDGRQSGVKLIAALCEDIIRVEGKGEEAELEYIGSELDFQ